MAGRGTIISKQNQSISWIRSAAIGGIFMLLAVLLPETVLAQDIQLDVDDIAENMVNSVATLPYFLVALCYLMGLGIGVSGVLKLKEHVLNPQQVGLNVPVIRFIIGGALFTLPIVMNAMYNSITGGELSFFDNGIFAPQDFFSGILGTFSGLLGDWGITFDINAVLSTIIASVEKLPGLITAAAYLLGLLFGVLGLMKIKAHVENPDQNPLKDGVAYLLIGGAFLAIPTIYTAMATAIAGGADNTGAAGILSGILGMFDWFGSGYSGRGCAGDSLTAGLDSATLGLTGMSGNSMGTVLCNLIGHTGAFPAFLNAMSYLFGLILGFWALLKLRDHITNPDQNPISQAVARFVAGGAFLTLPFVIEAIRGSVTPASNMGTDILGIFGFGGESSGFNVAQVDCDDTSGWLSGFIDGIAGVVTGGLGAVGETVGGWLGFAPEGDASGETVSSAGLDGRLYCAVDDVVGPLENLLSFFAVVAGMMFIMIGISRLLKSEQDGPKGPGGLGTLMTFITGGILISFNEFVRLISVTLFSEGTSATFATIQYTAGMNAAELAHANMVIAAILKFMIMIGLISFARGIFIIRGVAEGDNQSSMMAGITHLVAGALAINLGSLMNAVQATLGITSLGIAFT